MNNALPTNSMRFIKGDVRGIRRLTTKPARNAPNKPSRPAKSANAALRNTPGTVQERLWDGLKQLETIRAGESAFGAGAYVTTWDSHNNHVLALMRVTEDEKLVGLFNFTADVQDVHLDQMEGKFTDLITGEELSCSAHSLAPYQYIVCRQKMN